MLTRFLFIILWFSIGAMGAEVCDPDPDDPSACNGRGNCTVTREGADVDISCVCEVGFSGDNCETTTQFCDTTNHTCYHGGKCVKGIIQATGDTVHVCDCRTANENGISYVGLHCEKVTPIDLPPDLPVTEYPDGAIVCDDDGTDKFCLNDGTCIENAPEGTSICECDPEYTGYHCEFKRSELGYAGDYIPEATVEDSCSINCLNGGTCQVGFRNATDAEVAFNASFDPQDQIPTFEHCRCPDGTSGAFCERNYTECGALHCFHGSECTTNPATGVDYCQCTSNATNYFAGVGCQHHSTSFCTASEGVNGHQFCTNNGLCYAIGEQIFTCNCTSEFQGPHCEFPVEFPLPTEYESCTLQCDNGGVCAEGAKTHGILSTLDIKEIDAVLNITAERNNDDFEHCVCPPDFAGLTCETPVQVCPDGQHVCFHSSTCVPEGEDYQCDCESNSAALTAGIYCQHKATVVCNAQNREFCVNGGTCRDDGTCDCPDGHRGPHCEFTEQINDATDDKVPSVAVVASLPRDYKNRENDSILLAAGIVAGLGVLLIIVTVIVTGKSMEEIVETGPPPPPMTAFPPSTPPPPPRPTLDSAGDVIEGSARNLDVEVPPADNDDKDHVNELI